MPTANATELELVLQATRTLRPRTREIYLAAVESYLNFIGRGEDAWTPASVERWVTHLSDQGLAPQTVNLQLRGLRFAARRRARRGVGDFAATASGLKPAPAPKRTPLTVTQVRALLAACDEGRPIDLRDHAILVLGFRTGMRRSTMCQIYLHDLPAGNGPLEVRLKAGKRGTFPLDKETRHALGRWREWLAAQAERVPHSVGGKPCPCRGPLFRALARTRLSGEVTVREGMTEHGLWFVLQDRAKKAGVKHVYPHIFKTTFEAWTARGEVPAF